MLLIHNDITMSDKWCCATDF